MLDKPIISSFSVGYYRAWQKDARNMYLTYKKLKNVMRRYSKRRMNRRKTRSKNYYTVSRGGIRL